MSDKPEQSESDSKESEAKPPPKADARDDAPSADKKVKLSKRDREERRG